MVEPELAAYKGLDCSNNQQTCCDLDHLLST